ncbi:translation initiation factor 2 [Kitasatospora viridis]|uniref:Translation initiation factor 2 n=1 Tax=Kitasatospora viridis TaxID=281105 RepID=A0A561UA56_9ACTN|nr:translation initiation factor 2 [Kitasatospora viridis]TWF96245.1 hypothetical protein FHX73_119 [Kitasatospora viridis]
MPHTGRGEPESEQRTVLLAVRSAGALNRVLDVLPVFAGDRRIACRVTLVPGSEFGVEALAAVERAGVRVLTWAQALAGAHHLVLSASPKGALRALSGPRVLVPHGAGFNKSIPDEGSPDTPSGLDPHFLLDDGEPLAALHGLAHANQLDRLAEYCPPAADRAAVVGDPTLDRVLASLPYREAHRSVLGTGGRRLVVLTSTWGAESLLARRPELPRELLAVLPHDAYQVGLVLHPNAYSTVGSFDLSRRLAPALAAGLVLAEPHEEWAALLVAADAVVTDHGSTALYAAAAGCLVVNAYDGGAELLPGSPMAALLDGAPRLAGPAGLPEALAAGTDGDDGRKLARAAFELPGESLPRLRRELYRLLGLRPPAVPLEARPFPSPAAPRPGPAALAVRALVDGDQVTVERFPADTPEPAHHLAAEHPQAGPRALQSAAVLWRRARTAPPAPHSSSWTAAGWTGRMLAEHPACVTAAVVLDAGRCLLRHRSTGPWSVRIAPCRADGRVLRADPAAVLSAVHAWLATAPAAPPREAELRCQAGPFTVRVELARPTPAELEQEI